MASIEDGALAVAQVLSHTGVKGMKWGVRKEAMSSPSSVKSTKTHTVVGKTKIKTQGGHSQPASSDAVKAALLQQTFRKSGPKALTNQELQDLANRLNLEQSVSRVAGRKPLVGQKWAEGELKRNGSQQISNLAKKAATKAAVAAAVAA